MEKLVKLLNEYVWQDSYWIDEFDNGAFIAWWDGDQCFIDEHIISKNFWFIKWLVENDKINTKQLNLQVFKSIFSADWTVYVSYDEIVLMLLSISDEPIGLLIDMLK